MSRRIRRGPCIGMAVTVVLSGCVLPPHKQTMPVLPTSAPFDGLALQMNPKATWPAHDWWTAYQDPTLNQIVEMSLATSPTLAVAGSRFDQARASVREAGAAVGARVDLQGDFSRQRLSDNGLFPPQFLGFNWYNQADLGLQASYTFDWWGKQRAAVRAAVDAARASEAERHAAQLTLVSSIVDAYFGWQADQARLALAQERLENARRREAIEIQRVRAEIDSPDKINPVHGLVVAANDQQTVLEASAKLRIVALAALAGVPASQLPALTPKPLPELELELPADTGIDLLSRRPDIAASRWRVESAVNSSASARADFYPDLSLKALAGVSSLRLGKLLEAGSGVPAVTAAIHLPIFDAGRLKARYGATQAQLRSAVADYQEAVNAAARDVATQATMRQQVLMQRELRRRALDSAQATYDAARARVNAGVTDIRPQLEAEQDTLSEKDALLQLDAEAVSVDIALQRALGGGYESINNPI